MAAAPPQPPRLPRLTSFPSLLYCPPPPHLSLRRSKPLLCSCRSFLVRATSDNSPEFSSEAVEAVAEVLMDSGLALAEAARIASGSPRYVGMLVDGVRELDEGALWGRLGEVVEGGCGFSLKEKVKYMANQKGDRGMIAFLESLGLSSSSLLHIARYLSSENLPNIVAKVNYVKSLFFSEGDEVTVIGKNARRMMAHLSVYVDDEIQQTLSFFEKMEARRGGLNILDSGDASFPCLVESFPRLLLLSAESHYEPLVEFFGSVGIPSSRMKVLFLLFPPAIFFDIDKDIRPRLQALRKVGIEGTDIRRVLVKYPWIISTSIQGNIEAIYALFHREKVPKLCVDRAIKSWPHLLGCSANKLRTMVEQCAEFDVGSKKLGKIISSSPQLLLRKPYEFLEVVTFLEELGFNEENIGRLLNRCPEVFAASVENTLKKKIHSLTEFGIMYSDLPRIIRKYPEVLVSDIQNTLLPRMNYLISVGFTRVEVLSMVNRFSPLLGYSIDEVLKPKMEFLVHTMNKSIKDAVEYPRYFSYSLDKKIKPRFWILKGRGSEYTLKDMLGKNDEEFAAEYMGIGRMFVPL